MSRRFGAFSRWIRNIKIRHRLLYSFLILALFPLITIGFYSSSKSGDALFTKMNTYSSQMMNLLKDKIRAENQKFVLLSEQLSLNPVIQTAMKDFLLYDDSARRSIAIKIDAILREQHEMLSHMKNVILTTESGISVFDLGYDAVDPVYLEAQNAIINSNGNGGYILGHAVTKKGVPCIILSRPVNSASEWSNRLGYLHILIDESMYSEKLYQDLDLGDGSVTMIMSSSGRILSSGSPLLSVGHTVPDNRFMTEAINSSREPGIVHSVNLDSARYLVASAFDIFSDWYVISLIPYSYLNNETDEIRLDILLACLIVLLLAIYASYYLSSSILRPLQRLISSMRRIQEGELYVKTKDDSRDEFGYIQQRFNEMVHQIQKLLIQTEQEEKAKRETELQMLQAQINPHFLFNTLNSLKWAAMMSRTGEGVSRGLSALAELLRNTIVDKSEFVTLHDEIENLKNYITIQTIKYGSVFDVSYDIEPDLQNYQVLKFLLQPIVENSIIHGFEDIEDGGHLAITARQTGGKIEIVINDNGAGMSKDQLQRLQQPSYQSEGRLANIGIHNVKERIVLHFGEGYGLHLESEEGIGTKALITLPLSRTLIE
ncbi:cache domain-containing sensor histidine kinase [Paenibacillus lemnae]|uniref:histidine kinase n=1 Tax=Paenibacillus lemnae TaxID=1330551 RepID=A0A848M9F3_PAELE|nr:sensor histidine kinase [Paenibacillus lemnae]NMO97858.1 sensor histidine kinase [Paenibacillus lemnae]